MIIITKRLELADMEAAAIVHRRSFDERLPWIAGLHTPEEDLAFFENIVFERCEIWGCLEVAHLIGFIAFRENYIEHLYVLPAYQGEGLGTILLLIAQDRCDELELWTFQENKAARRFYERKGFVAVEMTDGTRNEENEPDVRYGWKAQ